MIKKGKPMDASKDPNANVSDVVEPTTEGERAELDEAARRYRERAAQRAAQSNVVYLPGAQLGQVPQADSGQGELVPDDAIEGELLSPQESADLDRRRAGGRVRQLGQVSVTHAGQMMHWVRQSEHPVGREVLRHSIYVLAGVGEVARKVREAHSNSRFERMIRAAEVTGDQDRVADWVTRAEQAKDHRHKRIMDWINAPLHLVKALGVMVLTVLGVLLGLGIVLAMASKDPTLVLAPITGVLAFVAWVAMVVTLLWTFIVMAAPVLGVIYLWNEGRRAGKTPRWLATTGGADMDVTIDETTIAAALAALRIPQITAYLKLGTPLQFPTPARRDGRGTHAVLRLPSGVTAERIARRRADLATGLHRLAKEVWPTTGAEAGILDLWIADKGALAEGAGPHPLLDDGLVDVFKGIPFGKTLRGDPVVAPVMERNTIVGGIPGQGKSAAARTLMCGAALDPTAELRIWVPDANFDFEAFRPRCSRYVMGAETEKIAEILEHLRELHEEVQVRGGLLVRYEIPEVTRELANRDVGLHPLFCLLEEAHVAITHPLHGGEISGLLVDIVRLGRKRGIHMIVSTQSPTKDNMPRDVTRNCFNGIAFAVGDHVANDGLLGQGAYAGGHRATELIVGADRGTAVVKGFTGERSELVQGYFLNVSRTNDQVTPIIDRALAAIADRGAVPGVGRVAPQIEAPRNLLEDLAEVLGNEPVKAADVPALLRELAPRWAPYRTMTGKSLRTELAALGIKVSSTKNTFPVDPVAVREALARQAAADLDDEDE